MAKLDNEKPFILVQQYPELNLPQPKSCKADYFKFAIGETCILQLQALQ